MGKENKTVLSLTGNESYGFYSRVAIFLLHDTSKLWYYYGMNKRYNKKVVYLSPGPHRALKRLAKLNKRSLTDQLAAIVLEAASLTYKRKKAKR